MFLNNLFRCALLASLFLSAACASAPPEFANAIASPSLDLFKRLEGEWLVVDENGEPTTTVSNSYEVNAGGNVVLERIFPGQPHEMLTIYHLDDDALTLTHYCVVGRHPEMRALPGADPNRVDFACTGGANIHEHVEPHMHEAHFVFHSEDRMRTTWKLFANGAIDHVAESELVRKK